MAVNEPVTRKVEQSDLVNDQWLVTISIDDRHDRTMATAHLQFRDRRWVGAGLSRLGAAEQSATGTGCQQAVTRALADLARSLGAGSGVAHSS